MPRRCPPGSLPLSSSTSSSRPDPVFEHLHRSTTTASTAMTAHSRHESASEPIAFTQSPSQSLESVVTYASTTASEKDSEDAIEHDQDYFVPEPPPDTSWTSIPPATAQEFASLFPSSRRLHISHDDSTVDGNMNLRVDTTVRPADGDAYSTQLFHLRMHDLRTRSFSLRRYCRESNREICHCSRKSPRPSPPQKPRLQRSISKTLHLFKHKNDSKSSSISMGVPRHDSGYGSQEELDTLSAGTRSSGPLTEDMQLDFSNYAHTALRRRGQAGMKHHDFEYWGHQYAWKRSSRKDSQSTRRYSYQLFRRGQTESIAHLDEIPLSAEDARQEKAKGGWVPPCSLWISDQATIAGAPDVCDAIVATGLMTLVDDYIRKTFQSKSTKSLVVPLPHLANLTLNKDHVDPHTLIDDTFHRTQAPIPLRQDSIS